ncbi:hypothetical protein HVA01_29370 [Halovibrio variabilis]|uniref:LysM domain-containing protein n=1 Tax=Halovibrio variabilis TaxID=31910 RepID=A0A511UTL3_9GAMM|nr:FimV/HubP family polar landmark protein [Halovibrio variabilis]GEN29291.1 hypothetical protein HVA01_29370 [Halovibrio variabilis]
MKNTLAWIIWLSLSAVSSAALAVELGPASVSSFLNAPLNATIPLLESSDYPRNAIRVSVAEQSAFAAQGLEWTPLAASVRAEVQEQQGRRLVRLRSEQAMDEPWLELLLILEYPGGQQPQAVTLLFDPQSYAQGYSQDGSQSQAERASPAATAEAPSATTPPPVSNTNANTGSANSAYVSSGDTLWGVAERVKPADASVQQTMVALLEANPAAFPAGNIHNMRAGQTLSVPDAERILARSHRDADAAIQAMNEAWRARRNGPLQAVPLPGVETAPVSETSIAAAQALQAGETQLNNALAAGGSEPVVPESDESATDDQTASEAPTDGPEALTRVALTEQLRLSQVTLQQVLEERELMRAELNELRGEVASLTASLSEALVAQAQPPAPLAARMQENDGPSVGAFIARYQWPLALVAIALLVALLIWLRKRREEMWEDVSFAEPVVKPTAAPGAAPKSAPMPEPTPEPMSEPTPAPMQEAVPVSYPPPPNEGDVDKPYNDGGRQPAFGGEPEPESATQAETTDTHDAPTLDPDQWLLDEYVQQRPQQEDDLRYENSQAAGLAEQGRKRRLGLHVVAVDYSAKVSLAPPPSAEPISQMLTDLGADLPAAAEAHVSATGYHLEMTEGAGHRFIDYHPPTLSHHDGERTDTLMQPTVEFQTTPPAPAPTPHRPVEEEWEIEEVAFKPRGLDNGDPSKSSK